MMPSATAALVACHRVLDAVLALLDLGLGRGAHLDDRDAAGQLGQPLLQLLPVPVGVGVLDVPAQLGGPIGHRFGGATTVDDGRRRPW